VAGGPIGAPGAPLDLRVNELVATTGSDAYLEEADGLTVQTLAAPHGSVALTSLTGDIRVLEVLALERGTLAAPGGSVVGDGSGPHVTARDLEVLAATGVSLVTVLQRLEASGGTRGVAIENNGSLIVGGIASALPAELTGLSAVESDVQLTVHGALTVVEDVQTIGLASILLSADGDLLIDALVKSDTGGQILAANGNLVAAAGAALSTVSGTIRLLPDQDQTGGGTLQFFGDIDVGAGRVVFHINDSASFFAGTVSGAGDLAKLGQGVLEITNASINTYTGTTQLLEGTLRVNGVIGAAQAAGTFFIASDAVLTGAGVVRAPIFSDARTAQIRSSGNLSLGDGSSAGFAFEGELIVGSGHVVTLNDADLAELGVMTMIVSGGRIVAANGVEVGTGDRLAGSGAVSGNIVVLSGGLVSPGASAGALTTNIGDVNLFPGSTYLVEIVGLQPGTQYDQLIVSGSVSVTGATLGLAGGGFRPPDGVVITLIANDGADPVVGRFFDGSGNLLDEGAMVRFGGVEAVVSFQGGPGANDVILTVTGFRFIRTSTGDNLLAPLAIVSDGGGAASQIRDRTVEAPVLFAEPPLTVAFAEAVDQRPAALEAGAAERLRVYFRVVNEATGEEEPREYELDPTYLRDVLVLFRRFKFQDGRYRIYLKEPNSRERLVLDVTIVDGRVVPPNVRDIESQELNPGPTQGESPSPAGAAREAENQGKVTEPGKTAAPSQGAVGAAGVAIAASAARRRLQTLLAGDVPRSRHALRLRQARPR
jgi:autotransporter-associated beta strand protein